MKQQVHQTGVVATVIHMSTRAITKHRRCYKCEGTTHDLSRCDRPPLATRAQKRYTRLLDRMTTASSMVSQHSGFVQNTSIGLHVQYRCGFLSVPTRTVGTTCMSVTLSQKYSIARTDKSWKWINKTNMRLKLRRSPLKCICLRLGISSINHLIYQVLVPNLLVLFRRCSPVPRRYLAVKI